MSQEREALPPFDEIALVDGARFVGPWGGVWTSKIHELGEISFPSGRPITCDALCTGFDGYPPLALSVPSTLAHAFISTAEWTREDGQEDDVTMALGVRFSDADAESWQPAYYEGDAIEDFAAGELPGFGVDSGTACIADARAAAGVDTEEDGEKLLQAINSAIGDPVNAVFHPSLEAHFVASGSGIGDGIYTPFWGLDADGEVVYLIIDFGLMSLSIKDSARFELPLKRGPLEHKLLRSMGVRARIPWMRWRKELHVQGRRYPQLRVWRDGESELLEPERREFGAAIYLLPADGELEFSFTVGSEAATPLEE